MASSAPCPDDAPDAQRSSQDPAEPHSISYRTYRHLIERIEGWEFDDLGDLLQEIRRDPELSEGERDRLLESVYRLIWQRAKPLLER